MSKRIIGYAILVVLYAISLFFGSKHGVWLSSVGAIVAVVVAMNIGSIRLPGIIIVFFVITFLIPVTTLYFMGLQANIDAPLRQVFQSLDWVRIVLPWMLAIGTYYFVTWIKAHLTNKRNSKPSKEIGSGLATKHKPR